MVRCAIMGCKSKTIKNGPTKFFSFPKDEKMREEWLRHCRSNITVKNARVCSKHFGPEDYFKSLRHILLNIEPKKIRTLKDEAVPRLQINGVVDEENLRLLTEEDNQMEACLQKSGSGDETGGDKNEDLIEIIVPTDHEYTVRNVPANIFNESNATKRPKKTKPEVPNQRYPIEMVPLNLLAKRSQLKIKSPGEIEISDPSGILYPIHIEPVKQEKPTFIVNCQKIEAETTPIPTECMTTPVTIDQHFRLPAGDDNSYVYIKQETVQDKNLNQEVKLKKSDYTKLVKKAQKFDILKRNLEEIFTPGQIRSIMKPTHKRRVVWSTEDITAAAALRKISPKGYRYLKNIVGFPLPGISTLCKWIHDEQGLREIAKLKTK